jgi:hypothetical protein
MVEEDEEQRDWSCEKWSSIAQSQRKSNIQQTIQRRQTNWIGHILRRNCFLKHLIEGKMEGRREVIGRGGRRNKQLLDHLKEKRECWKFKQEALDRTLWTAHFGSRYRPVVRGNKNEWMNAWIIICTDLFLFMVCLKTQPRIHTVH